MPKKRALSNIVYFLFHYYLCVYHILEGFELYFPLCNSSQSRNMYLEHSLKFYSLNLISFTIIIAWSPFLIITDFIFSEFVHCVLSIRKFIATCWICWWCRTSCPFIRVPTKIILAQIKVLAAWHYWIHVRKHWIKSKIHSWLQH